MARRKTVNKSEMSSRCDHVRHKKMNVMWRFFKIFSKHVGARLSGTQPKLLPGRWMNVGSNKQRQQKIECALVAECDAMQRRRPSSNNDDMVMRASMML